MTDVHGARDPELPGRLLAVERDALIPLLRARPDADFALATAACPGWTVRDVLAHCSAALIRVGEPLREGRVLARVERPGHRRAGRGGTSHAFRAVGEDERAGRRRTGAWVDRGRAGDRQGGRGVGHDRAGGMGARR
ncbi:maleylpyruvate isomerase N-terminal domain-containing protein [Streptomyces sp. NPDC086549]|uniref:maleylpyruvate isomerase N-terminal domain-containing protein n=1 Tax=Streptomyces sp. NPDC086549 TaxID=3365752 RepID=UPI0038084F6B